MDKLWDEVLINWKDKNNSPFSLKDNSTLPFVFEYGGAPPITHLFIHEMNGVVDVWKAKGSQDHQTNKAKQ